MVPGIHAFVCIQDVDGRDKPGHDGGEMPGPACASHPFLQIPLKSQANVIVKVH
jgi:hypothetical protein